MSQKTAASSNHFYQSAAGGLPHFGHQRNTGMHQQYSTAVIGGGGPNIYDRLLNDSTENLLRPTAQMIGSANRITASFHSQKPWVLNLGQMERKNPR